MKTILGILMSGTGLLLVANSWALSPYSTNFEDAPVGQEVAIGDGSGVINFSDLQILTEAFFQPPGPSGIASCGVR